MIIDRASQQSVRNRLDALRQESQELEVQTRQLTDALETLVRIQAKWVYKDIQREVFYNFDFLRSLDSQLFNKANELQEDISLKRFDLRVAQVHLAAVRAQVGTALVT